MTSERARLPNRREYHTETLVVDGQSFEATVGFDPKEGSPREINVEDQATNTKRCEGNTVLPQQRFVHPCPYNDAPCPWVEVYRDKHIAEREVPDDELKYFARQLPCHHCGVATEAQASGLRGAGRWKIDHFWQRRTRGGIPMRRLIATAISLALILGACGGDDSDPAAVLADYLEVWNAEDGEAVMVFYAEDAVIEGHPEDTDGLATGKSEILPIEQRMQIHQGSTGRLEFTNMVVSGDTVTFDDIFHNGDGDCFSSTGDKVTVEDDKITLYVFGELDPDLC